MIFALLISHNNHSAKKTLSYEKPNRESSLIKSSVSSNDSIIIDFLQEFDHDTVFVINKNNHQVILKIELTTNPSLSFAHRLYLTKDDASRYIIEINREYIKFDSITSYMGVIKDQGINLVHFNEKQYYR